MQTARSHCPLDGEWKLVLDPEDAGIDERWFEVEEHPEAQTVHVPSVWDRWIPDYDGVGWYFRRFAYDDAWRGLQVDLHFDAVDYYAEVWLNGVRLGDHEGGYTPFAFNATAHLQEGGNLLAVRVVDPHGEDGYGDFRLREIPCAKEDGYWSFAGIWGSVSLEAKPPVHIEDLFIQPDLRRKRITVDVTASGPAKVRLQIEGTDYATEGEPGSLTIDFPEFTCWSPETPVLYTLRTELIPEEGPPDCVEHRFGMREFSVKDKRFHLNNRPLFIKAVLHQPDYPRSLAAPESEEMARREIQLAKDAGFNMLRLHIKPAPKITLQLADELGMLLYAEPPIGWIAASDQMQARCEREVREMILRDRNHPSVVIWGMLNESGNAGYKTGGGAQTIKEDLCRLARSLDRTRLIIDDSGGSNGTRESARMMRPYRDTLEEYDDLHIYQRAPVDNDIERYYRHSGSPDKLFFLSEFGFGGPEDLEDVIAQYGDEADRLKDARFLRAMLEACQRGYAERNLDRVFGSFGEFTAAARTLQCDAIRFQIDAIRTNPRAGGYCYTQLADAGHEFCAGMLDRWRRPKPAFKALAAVQQPLRPVIQLAKTNLTPREEVSVSVLLLNEAQLEGRADLSLQVVGPTNQVLWKKKRSVKIPRHGKELWTGTVAASGSPGPHRFVVRLMQGMKRLAENDIALHVTPETEQSDVEIHVLDPRKEWQSRLAPLAKRTNVLAPIHVIPPLGNSIRAYPDNELMQVLAQVYGGAVAIWFGPPEDWNDLAERIDASLTATPKDGVGAFLPVCHYVKLHPVFDGLPARGLMRQPYRNVAPARSFIESGDEEICGSFDATPVASGNYMMDETPWWGTDILVRLYGSGRIVFTHLRVLEHLGEDPVADRLFVNMLNHFTRRSVPSDTPLAPQVAAVEWLRNERNNNARRWMVLGEFPNGGDGHDRAYPPEEGIDLEATYPGWYKAITWKPWHATTKDGYRVDLQEAFSPIFQYYPRFDYAVGYAYAEFSCDRRQEVELKLGIQNAMKIWLNGTLVFSGGRQVPHDQYDRETVPARVRQGRNVLLVKVTKTPGPFRFSLDLSGLERDPLQLNWWK